jgi:hypothetical protein
MYGISNNRDDIFILSRNGIIMDNNVESHMSTHRSIGQEIETHYNQGIGYNCMEILLRNLKRDMIFYEPIPPYKTEDHTKLTVPSKEGLKEVFYKEGIEGLAGYVFTVPAYITEDGDIFGTPDIGPDGNVNPNYKIIVVQRFSIYDIISRQKLAFHTERDVFNAAKDGYTEMLKSSTISYICITMLDLISLCFLIILITRTDKKNE